MSWDKSKNPRLQPRGFQTLMVHPIGKFAIFMGMGSYNQFIILSSFAVIHNHLTSVTTLTCVKIHRHLSPLHALRI